MGSNTVYTIVIIVLAVIVIGLMTVLIYYYRQNQGCITNQDFWCWNDWKCPAGTQKEKLKPSDIYGPDSLLAKQAAACTIPGGNCNCDWAGGSNNCMNSFCTNKQYNSSGQWVPFDVCKTAS